MTDKHLFEGKPPEIRAAYDRLLTALRKIGEYEIEPKKTSIHISHGRAFIGVHPKTSYLGVYVVLDRDKANPVADKTEQVSRNRFHHFYKLQSSKQIDVDFMKLVKDAYKLTAE